MTAFAPGYQFKKRTVLIDGKQTSLAMERVYWNGLEKIAKDRGVTWQELVGLAMKMKPKEFSSRAGWLRIWVFAKILDMTKREKQAT